MKCKFERHFLSSDVKVNFPVDEAKGRSRIYSHSYYNHNDVLQAYVWNNNVYIKASPAAEPVQITHNGEENKIFNGIPDWVYEGNCQAYFTLHYNVKTLFYFNYFIITAMSFLIIEMFQII